MINVKDPPYNAKGDNAADDRDAIQGAIRDAAGQIDHTVFIPAGTYIIGTPSLSTNKPLVVPSKVKLIGEGIGHTTLLLPKNASQRAPWGSARLESRYANHLATLIVNKGNQWWFGTNFNYSEVLLQPDNGIEQVLPNDDIEIAYMTLDANNVGQPEIYERGADASTSKGKAMFISASCALSQVSHAYLHDLELCNSADSALDFRPGSAPNGKNVAGVSFSRFERLWIHGSGWAALSINGEANDVTFDSCVIEKNDNQAVAITFT